MTTVASRHADDEQYCLPNGVIVSQEPALGTTPGEFPTESGKEPQILGVLLARIRNSCDENYCDYYDDLSHRRKAD